MRLIKIYLAGLAVLIAAILLNLLANAIGVATWYSFLIQASGQGFSTAAQDLNALEILFLVVIYPLCLGAAAYLTLSLTKHLNR
jgi:hypothetical protein